MGLATDEPLLERLRVLVSDPTTDHHVKAKAVELFGSWSNNFRNEKGMERLAGLKSQLPTKAYFRFLTLMTDVRNVSHQQFAPLPPITTLPVLLAKRGDRDLVAPPLHLNLFKSLQVFNLKRRRNQRMRLPAGHLTNRSILKRNVMLFFKLSLLHNKAQQI